MLLAALLLVSMVGCSNNAQEAGIVIDDVWARESPTADGNGAVFMTLKNSGAEADALVGASAAICEAVELHETTMENDVMRMQPVPGQRIDLPAGGEATLKPGGLHVMLMGLKQQLQPGQRFTLSLQFEKAGERQVEVEVRPLEETDADAMGG